MPKKFSGFVKGLPISYNLKMLQKYTLPNGIPVFIVETDQSPVVTLQAWVKRGSIHEPASLAGISHFLEHALFKGTKKRKVGEIAREIESHGGDTNAFTSFEQTAFYLTLASEFFDEGLDILSDMMLNPAFDFEEIEKEKEVILEEIKRAFDSPWKLMSMNLWQEAFKGTPFGRPVLGFQSTVKKINAKSLKTYFQNNYHSGTMALFCVGNVDAEKSFLKIKQAFSSARRVKEKEKIITLKNRKLNAPVTVSLQRDLKESYALIGFPMPGITDPKIPFYDLMASSIGQGESGRLYQALVKEKKVALDVGFSLSSTQRGSLLTLSLTSKPEKMEAAIQEAHRVLVKVANEGISKEEIEIVKTSLESDVVAGKETVENYARRLGYYYCEFGDPEAENKYLQNILNVSPDQATLALRTALSQNPIASFALPTQAPLINLKTIWKSSEKPLKKRAEPKSTLEKKEVLGVPFVYKATNGLPILSFRLLFKGGSREESTTKQGVGNLFARTWLSGTKNYSSLDISKKLERLGASITAFVGRNSTGLSIECLSKHWGELLPVFTDILNNPSFPEKEVSMEKELIDSEIRSERDMPVQVCQLEFLKAIYRDHAYGRPPQGTLETLEKISTVDLRNFYETYITKSNCALAFVGEEPNPSFVAEIEKLLKPLSDKKVSVSPFLKALPQEKKIISSQKQPLFQAHLMVGFLGPTLFDKNRIALKILSSALQGQGGRLFLELRDKQSLAYTVTPLTQDSPDPGFFGFYIGCSQEKWKVSLQGIKKEIVQILEKPLSEKELKRAKQYWLGRVEMDLQRFGSQSLYFGLDELYGLGIHQIEETKTAVASLTSKKIQEIAQQYFLLEKPVISLVHPDAISEEEINTIWNSISLKKQRSSSRAIETSI